MIAYIFFIQEPLKLGQAIQQSIMSEETGSELTDEQILASIKLNEMNNNPDGEKDRSPQESFW